MKSAFLAAILSLAASSANALASTSSQLAPVQTTSVTGSLAPATKPGGLCSIPPAINENCQCVPGKSPLVCELTVSLSDPPFQPVTNNSTSNDTLPTLPPLTAAEKQVLDDATFQYDPKPLIAAVNAIGGIEVLQSATNLVVSETYTTSGYYYPFGLQGTYNDNTTNTNVTWALSYDWDYSGLWVSAYSSKALPIPTNYNSTIPIDPSFGTWMYRMTAINFYDSLGYKTSALNQTSSAADLDLLNKTTVAFTALYSQN